MTSHDHDAQRDRVAASLRLADSPEARHGTYPARCPQTHRETPPMRLDEPEADLIARALLYAACSPHFDRAEADILLELRDRVWRPFSLAHAQRVVRPERDA